MALNIALGLDPIFLFARCMPTLMNCSGRKDINRFNSDEIATYGFFCLQNRKDGEGPTSYITVDTLGHYYIIVTTERQGQAT